MNLGTESSVFVLGRTEFHVKLGEGSVCVCVWEEGIGSELPLLFSPILICGCSFGGIGEEK